MVLCLHQKAIIHLNVYAPKNKASKYMKINLIEPQGKTDKSTTTARLQQTSLNNWQKIRKNIDLHNTVNQLNLTDIYKTLNATTEKYTLF